MFTGIIQGTAEVVAIDARAGFRTHVVRLPEALLPGLEPGASVAHNGCCLTVGAVNGPNLSVHLIPETLTRTNIGTRRPGDRVNVEIDPQTQAIVETVERVLAERGAG